MNRKLSPSADTAHPLPGAPVNASVQSPRVLIVDDDPFLCGLYSLLLDQHGYETVTAENGEDALTQLASGQFDLMITDRAMPVLDGAGLILALRSAGFRIPVIMITGSAGLSPLLPAVAREICMTLIKPAHSKEILAAVAMALQTAGIPDEEADAPPEKYPEIGVEKSLQVA